MNDQARRPVKTLGSLLDGFSRGVAEPAAVCPVCGEETVQQKCKVVCRSEKCVYRIIYNCSEF